jgi:hypothetical protein
LRRIWLGIFLRKTEPDGLQDLVLAIDWSGALAPAVQRRSIAVACADVSGGAVTLRRGLLRGEVEAEVAALGRSGAQVVAGLDFSFSLPEHFVEQQGCASALAARAGAPAFLGSAQGRAPACGAACAAVAGVSGL